MNLDIKDVLYNSSQKDKQISEKKVAQDISGEKKIQKKKKTSNNKIWGSYILGLILDFIIFGILFLLVLVLENTVLIEISGDINRVLVMNKITTIVMANIFLFSYFYFYAKDKQGSTIGMKVFGVQVVSQKNKITLTTTLFSNVVFWIFFILIDINLLNSLDNIIINMWAVLILVLQIFILLILNGFRLSGIKIKLRDKEEKNEK